VHERTGGNKAEAASGDLPDDKAWSVTRLEFGTTTPEYARLVDALLCARKTARVSKVIEMQWRDMADGSLQKTHPKDCPRCNHYENKKHAVSTSGCAGCSGMVVVGAVRHKRKLARKLPRKQVGCEQTSMDRRVWCGGVEWQSNASYASAVSSSCRVRAVCVSIDGSVMVE